MNSYRNTRIALLTLLALVPGLLAGCGRNGAGEEALKEVLSESLLPAFEGDTAAVIVLASIAEAGSGRRPVSVLYYRRDDGGVYSGYHDHEDLPVPPGGIMQTATLTHFLDNGYIALSDSVPTRHGVLPEFRKASPPARNDPFILDFEEDTGRDFISVREGFLKSYRYVTDRYVLDIVNRYAYAWDAYMDCFYDYFGAAGSSACRIPSSVRNDPVGRAHLAVADGSGLCLSQEQIVAFHRALATGGVRPAYRYFPKKRICSEETAREVSALLRENVLGGTCRDLQDCTVPVVARLGTGVVDSGFVTYYGDTEELGAVKTASVAGFFPYDDPEYVLCVTCYSTEHPLYDFPKEAFKTIAEQLCSKPAYENER